MTDRPLKVPPGYAPPLDPDSSAGAAPTGRSTARAETQVRDGANTPEEPYLLIPRGFDVNVESKATANRSITNFVSDGCLTPVLGSEMTDALTVPGQAILRDRLVEAHFGSRKELGTFHTSLFAGRHLDRVLIEDPRPAAEKLPAADAAIAALRLALLEAAYYATALFASEWSVSVSPLFEWNLHAVMVDPERNGSFGALVGALQGAKNAIATFREAQTEEQEAIDHREDLLGALGLGTRLAHLHDVLDAGNPLRGSTVEWLTDVLWHALTFDSPCYPTREELALQVSLAVDSPSPIEKVELTALAPWGLEQNWEPYRHAMSRTLTGLQGGSRAVPPVGKLHAALASSLGRSYRKWRQEGAKKADERVPGPASLAITLTTDLELERALATDEGGSYYHVAFPMVLTSANHNNRGHLRWVVGTFESGVPNDDPDLWQRLVRPVGEWQLLNDVAESFVLAGYGTGLQGGLEGPLVLKANGSPLHEVEPDLADNPALRDGFLREISTARPERVRGRRGGKARHVPATTELDILQLTQVDQWAMGSDNGRAGLPTYIRKLLEGPTRGWLILGHDLSEWSSRLQLFTQISLSSLVQPSRNGDSRVRERTLAVVRKADEQRTRLLLGMDIPLTHHAELKPDDVAAAIQGALHKRQTR